LQEEVDVWRPNMDGIRLGHSAINSYEVVISRERVELSL
jgi:hypothetical protein